MVDRRPLTEGITQKMPPPMDPATERAFVHSGVSGAAAQVGGTMRRTPITTRMREDFAKALKRASLERQLSGEQPNAIMEIIEQAIEPWLKANGYLP